MEWSRVGSVTLANFGQRSSGALDLVVWLDRTYFFVGIVYVVNDSLQEP